MSAESGRKLLTAPVGVVPDGLLDFFFLKSMGENPQSLASVIQPTMDVLRWFADGRALNVSLNRAAPFAVDQIAGSAPIQSTGPTDLFDPTVGEVRVPQGEIWLLLELSSTWVFGAVAGQVCPAVGFTVLDESGLASSHRVAMNYWGAQASNAVANLSGHAAMLHPLIIPGGNFLRFDQNGIVVAGSTVSIGGSMRVLRLRR